MATPATAKNIGTLDPNEELDFLVPLAPVLEPGEEIASYTLELLPEAVALGLTIMTGSGRDHALALENTAIYFWLNIDPDFIGNAAFDGGIALPMQVTAITNSDPARKRQRTFLVSVVQL